MQWNKILIGAFVLGLVMTVEGCNNSKQGVDQKIDLKIENETEDYTDLTSFGRKIEYGNTYNDKNNITYVRVKFVDDKIGVLLPKALWNPDEFYSVAENGMEEESVDKPLIDWADEDSYSIVTPSTAYMSVSRTEEYSDNELEMLKEETDNQITKDTLEKKIFVKSIDNISREEIEGAYVVCQEGTFAYTLYGRVFEYYGYYIKVYQDNKITEFVYGECCYDDLESYHTYDVVYKSFYLLNLEKMPSDEEISS